MSRKGFTLIELLVVMGLMALLTAMVFSNSFGMSQASAYSSAQETVYNVLQMARQRACIDGKDVFVVLRQDDPKRPTLAIIEGYGHITTGYQTAERRNKSDDDKSKGCFIDNGYSMQRPTEASVDIYNLTSGGRARLAGVDDEPKRDDVLEIDGSGGTRAVVEDCDSFEHTIRQIWLAPIPAEGGRPAVPFRGADWKAGDIYGFSVLPDQRLPKGFRASIQGGDTICFYGDGTSGVRDFKSGEGTVKNRDEARIVVAETIDRKNGKTIEFSVKGGLVKVVSSARLKVGK